MKALISDPTSKPYADRSGRALLNVYKTFDTDRRTIRVSRRRKRRVSGGTTTTSATTGQPTNSAQALILNLATFKLPTP